MPFGRDIHHGNAELAAIIPTELRRDRPIEQRRVILTGEACGRITIERHTLMAVGEEMMDMAREHRLDPGFGDKLQQP